MEIILVANEKGGTAKSATCLCLANCLTALGYRVAVVDTDPSGNLSAAALDSFPPYVLYDIFTGACDLKDILYKTPFGDVMPTIKDIGPAPQAKKSFIIPNRKNLGELFAGLQGQENSEQYLTMLLRESGMENVYDFVIIDSAPAANLLITNAIVVADSVIVPCEPNSASVDGFNMFVESIMEVKQKYKTNISVDGLVFTKFTDEWKTRREHVDGITAKAKGSGIYVYNTKFRLSSAIETSMNDCRPILDYINQGSGAYDSMNFTLEFLAKRGLEPKQDFPGVFKNESGMWIFRKNGSLYYTYTMVDGKAHIESKRFKTAYLQEEAFMDAVGKTIFFCLENLEAHLIQENIPCISDKEKAPQN